MTRATPPETPDKNTSQAGPVSWLKRLLPNTPAGRVTSGDELDSQPDATLVAITAEEKPEAVQTPENGFSGRRLGILLMLGAIFSKLLGLMREIGMAHMFGTTVTADAFRASVAGVLLPLLVFRAETVPIIMIPMYRDWSNNPRIAQLFAALALTVTAIGTLIMGLVLWLSSLWVYALVGGFSAEGQALTRYFLSIMALGMPGAVLINVLSAGEIALGRSRLTTLLASVLNLSIIGGLGAVVVTGQLVALPVAFALAFDGLALWGLVTLAREGVISFRDLRWSECVTVQKEFWRRVAPILTTPIAEQANIWVERLIASRIAVGAVASLDYARTITESAVLFISQPIGMVLLAMPPDANPGEQVDKLSRPLLACSLPPCAWLFIFGPEATTFLFSRGAFNETAVELTGQALRGIALGLWATTLGWVLLRMLNSAGKNRRATLILLVGFAVNIASNFVLYEVPSAKSYGPFLVGFGESLRGFVLLFGSALMLGSMRQVLRLLVMALPATLLMTLIGLWLDNAMEALFPKLMLSGLACVFCILLGLMAMGSGILRQLIERVRGRLGKKFSQR